MSSGKPLNRTDWAEKENVLRGGSKEVGARRRTAEEETAERKTDTHHKPLKPLLKKSGPVVATLSGRKNRSSTGRHRVAQKGLDLWKPRKDTPKAVPRALPFVSRTNLYDDCWINKQEKGFTRWLNHILVPVDQYGHVIPPTKDLGVTSTGSLSLEEGGREARPSLPLSGHRGWYRLRRMACLLYQSEPLAIIHARLEEEIESERLLFRRDLNPAADVGLRRDVADMLVLNYSHVWLRLGLETVFGVYIEASPVPAEAAQILSCFILDHLLSNPCSLHSATFIVGPGSSREGHPQRLSHHVLRKFLMLVIFLDRAKLTRFLDHNPCLFQPSATIKSSRDMLQRFSRKYLAGEGDIIRHLSLARYVVTHVQTALDEFDYHVENLATDLRDGLRITRLVEILTGDWELSRQLRVPATTRMQRLHNVEVALSSLGRSMPVYERSAEAVVDGHREKTLALLWSIIFHFKVKLQLNVSELKEEIAVLESQRPHHLSYQFNTGRRSSLEPVIFPDPTLSLILHWCRAVGNLYGVQVCNFTNSFSDGRLLCYLIHHYHPSLLPLHLITNYTTLSEPAVSVNANDDSLNENTTCWTGTFSPTTGKDPVRERLLENEKNNFKLVAEKLCALGGVPLLALRKEMSNTLPDEKVVITYVSYLCHQLLLLRKEGRAAVVIQRAWRTHRRFVQSTAAVKRQQEATLVIQAFARSTLAQKRYHRLKHAVCTIQHTWRSHRLTKVQRHKYLELRGATIVFQRRLRVWLQLKARNRSVTIIQTCFRGYLARTKYRAIMSATRTLQKYSRSFLTGARLHRHYLKQRSACIKLQAAFRGWKVRHNLAFRHKAATTICAHYRGCRARLGYRALCHSTRVVQARFRANVLERNQRKVFLSLKRAALLIQCRFRGARVRRQIAFEHEVKQSAAITIQRVFRGHIQRKMYLSIQRAARVIQCHWRATLSMRAEQRAFLSLRQSSTVIQAWFRAKLLAREQMALENRAATNVQRIFRGFRERKRFSAVRAAVAVTQTRWRATLRMRAERSAFLTKKRRVGIAQAAVRGFLARRRYHRMQCCAVVIQARVRSHLARRRYLQTRAAAIKIQARVRGMLGRREYIRSQRAAVTLQAAVRAFLARRSFLGLRSATVALQARARGYLARRHFLRLAREHGAVVKLQAASRGYLIRKQFIHQMCAVVTLQCHARRYLAQKRYSTARRAVVVIQKNVRRFIAQQRYRKTLKAVVSLQANVRRFLAKKELCKMRAVLAIQALARGRAVRWQVAHTRRCILTLQAHTRGFLARKKFVSERCHIVTCQAQVRMFIARRQYRRSYSRVVLLQSQTRGCLARRTYHKSREAVITLQAAFRGRRARQMFAKTRQSVIVVQSWARGYIARKKHQHTRDAVVLIQAHCRGYLARCLYRREKSARLVQAAVRGYLVRSHYRQTRRRVILCQAAVRGHLIRKKFQQLRRAVCLLQSNVRTWHARRQFCQNRTKIIAIQALARGFLARRHYQREKSAILAQAVVRGYLVRKHYQRTRSSVILCQAAVRGHLSRKRYLDLCRAVCLLQSHVRALIAKRQYCHDRTRIINIQALVRGHLARQQYHSVKTRVVVCQAAIRRFLARNRYRKIRLTVCGLQAHARGLQLRKEVQRQRASIVKCQAVVRGHLVHKRFKHTVSSIRSCQAAVRAFLERKRRREAATLLQAVARGWISRRRSRRDLAHITRAQSTVRGYLARRQYQRERAAVVVCQSVVRRHQAMGRYSHVLQSVILLQARVRGILNRRRHRARLQHLVKCQACVLRFICTRRYLRTRRAITLCQAVVRRRIARQKYLAVRNHVIQIQAFSRAALASKRYKRLKTAAVVAQAHRRGLVTRRNYLRQQRAALTLQTHVRGWVARKHYSKVIKGVQVAQKYYRRHVSRARFVQLKSATIVLQCYTRRWMAMRRFKSLAIEIKRTRAAVTIQSAVRSFLAQRRYRKYRQAAITLQSYTRRKRAMDLLNTIKGNQRRESAARVIQSAYRSYVVYWRYQQTREACVVIQTQWRGWLDRRRYQRLRWAVGVVGERYAAVRRGREVRMEQGRLKWAALVIEERYLALREGRKDCQYYQRFYGAVLYVQRCFRGWSMTRTLRGDYLAMRRAAVVLQAAWRGTLARRQLTSIRCAVKQEKAALAIQAMWKGRMVRKKQSTPAVRAVRERLRQVNASAQRAHSIRHRLPAILQRLKKCKYLSSLDSQLHTLELMTLASESCSRALVGADCLPVLLELIDQTNRSQAALVVVAGIIRVLSNIARWNSTRSSLFLCPQSAQVLTDLVYRVHTSQLPLVQSTLELMAFCATGTKVKASGTTVKKLSAMRDNLTRRGTMTAKKGPKHNTLTKHLDKILNSLS